MKIEYYHGKSYELNSYIHLYKSHLIIKILGYIHLWCWKINKGIFK